MFAMFARRRCGGLTRIGGRPHRISAIYFMNPMGYVGHNSLNQGGFFRADVYVDISDVIDQKIRALDCIESQYYDGAYARKRAETEDGRYGGFARVPYAEQFQQYMPRVCYKLPVSEYDLLCAEETSVEGMARRGHMTGCAVPTAEGRRPSTPDYRLTRELYDA